MSLLLPKSFMEQRAGGWHGGAMRRASLPSPMIVETSQPSTTKIVHESFHNEINKRPSFSQRQWWEASSISPLYNGNKKTQPLIYFERLFFWCLAKILTAIPMQTAKGPEMVLAKEVCQWHNSSLCCCFLAWCLVFSDNHVSPAKIHSSLCCKGHKTLRQPNIPQKHRTQVVL